MKSSRLLVLAAFLLPRVAEAQRPAGPLWESYGRAAATLRAAIAAHGGNAVLQLTGLSFRWEGNDYSPFQGVVPAWDSARNRRAAAAQATLVFAGPRFLVEQRLEFGGGYSNQVRLSGIGNVFVNVDPSARFQGTTFGRDSGGVQARAVFADYAGRFPLSLLRRAVDAAASGRYLGSQVVDGRREDVIGFTEADGRALTLAFDAATHLVAARLDLGVGSLGDEVDAWRFGEYVRRDGLQVPTTLHVTFNGLLASRLRLAEFSPVASLGDSILVPPASYARRAPPQPLRAVPESDGVYFIENIAGGYRSLVVDTEEGLVVVDAPVAVAPTQQAIASIERTFPGRPIRYVVVTHHHADHIGGLAAYVAKGATILLAPGSERYVRDQIAAPRTVGRISPTPTVAPSIAVVPSRRVIGSASREVHVINASPTSHAASMLAVWIPSVRLLFQGDLLRLNQPGGVAHAPQALRDLDRIIRVNQLPVATIGAVHGANATVEQLREALAAQAPVLAITHVTVLPMTGSAPLRDATVIVRNDRVVALGPAATVAVPGEARVVDATGRFLIPGLWDMHVHAAGGGRHALPLYVANGVTGVRDMGGYFDSVRTWRADIRSGRLVGPEIIAAGPILDGPTPGWPFRVAVLDTAAGRRAVDSLASLGVDFIKVHQQLSRDAYFAIAQAARRRGIPFAGHVPVPRVSAAEAAASGQRSIEHLTGVPAPCPFDGRSAGCADSAAALYALFRRHGTWHVPTLIFWQTFVGGKEGPAATDARLRYASAAERRAWAEQLANWPELPAATKERLFTGNLRVVGELHRAGVPLLAGTDMLIPYEIAGFSLHDELALLVRAGLSPEAALRAATVQPATFLGLSDSVGTIAVGKRADFVLLDADPLADIRNTTRIRAVVARGRFLDRAQLDVLLRDAERAAAH